MYHPKDIEQVATTFDIFHGEAIQVMDKLSELKSAGLKFDLGDVMVTVSAQKGHSKDVGRMLIKRRCDGDSLWLFLCAMENKYELK